MPRAHGQKRVRKLTRQHTKAKRRGQSWKKEFRRSA